MDGDVGSARKFAQSTNSDLGQDREIHPLRKTPIPRYSILKLFSASYDRRLNGFATLKVLSAQRPRVMKV